MGKHLFLYNIEYFKSYNSNPSAQKFLDGWIIKKGKFYTFYGIIKPKDLTDLCIKHGLKILHSKLLDGSIYLEVSV